MTIQTDVIQRIGQIAVPVLDIKRSIHFYKDVLGLHTIL